MKRRKKKTTSTPMVPLENTMLLVDSPECPDYKGLTVLRETTADKVSLPGVLIAPDMELDAGWGYAEHLEWVTELTNLKIPPGSIIATDEECSEVWLLERDHFASVCRLVHLD